MKREGETGENSKQREEGIDTKGRETTEGGNGNRVVIEREECERAGKGESMRER